MVNLFCISVRDVCRPSAASTQTTIARGIFDLDNLFQPPPVVENIVIPQVPVNNLAPLQDFLATLAQHAAAAPHGHTITNPNLPTPELIERLIIPLTPANARDFQESSSIRIGKTVYLLAITKFVLGMASLHHLPRKLLTLLIMLIPLFLIMWLLVRIKIPTSQRTEITNLLFARALLFKVTVSLGIIANLPTSPRTIIRS